MKDWEEALAEALTVAVPATVKLAAVALNEAEDVPAGTVIPAGTVTGPVAVSDTTVPPAGAAAVRLTEQGTDCCGDTEDGLQVN